MFLVPTYPCFKMPRSHIQYSCFKMPCPHVPMFQNATFPCTPHSNLYPATPLILPHPLHRFPTASPHLYGSTPRGHVRTSEAMTSVSPHSLGAAQPLNCQTTSLPTRLSAHGADTHAVRGAQATSKSMCVCVCVCVCGGGGGVNTMLSTKTGSAGINTTKKSTYHILLLNLPPSPLSRLTLHPLVLLKWDHQVTNHTHC